MRFALVYDTEIAEHVEQPYPDLVGNTSNQLQPRLRQLHDVIRLNQLAVVSLPLFKQQFMPVAVRVGPNRPEQGFYVDRLRSDTGGLEWVFDDEGCARLCPAVGQPDTQQRIERDATGVRDWWSAQSNRNHRLSQH